MKQVNLGFYRMVLFLLLGLFTSVIGKQLVNPVLQGL